MDRVFEIKDKTLVPVIFPEKQPEKHPDKTPEQKLIDYVVVNNASPKKHQLDLYQNDNQ